jgi:ATP-binding cassette, subfamily B, bacterial PglK
MNSIRKLYALLTSAQRKRSLVVLGLFLISMVVETLGVSFVIPTLTVLSNQNIAASYPQLEPLLLLLGNPRQEVLLLWAVTILVLVYGFKALLLSVVSWYQAGFVSQVERTVAQRLFEGYMRQPWTFHLQRNSAQLIRNIVVGGGAVGNGLVSSLFLLSEGLVLLGMSILLFAVEPVGALWVIAVVGSAAIAFSALTKGKLILWGKAHQEHQGMRLQHIQQGLGAVKEILLLGRAQGVFGPFDEHSSGLARIARRQAILQQLPRVWLEVLGVVGLACLVVVMIAQKRVASEVVPIVGLFGAAAFRVMPSINRVLGCIQNIRSTSPVIETLAQEMRSIEAISRVYSDERLSFRESLSIERVTFHYPGADNPVLHEVSLTVQPGSIIGIIGRSGAGKSTLLDVILGLLEPTSGRVCVDGCDIRKNTRGWQDQIGYVPQSIYVTDDTLRRNVALGLPDGEIDDNRIRWSVSAAQLGTFVAALPNGLDTMVGERGIRLSGGQRQRIGIARALYHDPSVLVLDEATNALDPTTERAFLDTVSQMGKSRTILIVAHRISAMGHCDKIYRINAGKLIQDESAAERPFQSVS